MAKFSWKGYWEPTPKGIVKIANAIVTGCTFAGGALALNGNPKLGTAIFVTGVVAKMISEFFSEEKTSN